MLTIFFIKVVAIGGSLEAIRRVRKTKSFADLRKRTQSLGSRVNSKVNKEKERLDAYLYHLKRHLKQEEERKEA